MKKIVIVDGGPRKNMNTAQLLQRFADGHEMVGVVEALLGDLMQNGVYTPRKWRY